MSHEHQTLGRSLVRLDCQNEGRLVSKDAKRLECVVFSDAFFSKGLVFSRFMKPATVILKSPHSKYFAGPGVYASHVL